MAERARRAVEAIELDHEGQQVSVTMSLGLAVFPDDGDDILSSSSGPTKPFIRPSARGATAPLPGRRRWRGRIRRRVEG
jgi:hypothetical protein